MQNMTLKAPSPRTVSREIIGMPGEDLYERGRRAFNLAADQQPCGVAVPRDEHEVADVIRLANGLGLKIAPQCTGHGATALAPLEQTMLLRTDSMRDVQVDAYARRARVGAGARWEDVIGDASLLGLAAMHGSSPTVGVTGYTLGGGLSWYARAHGLAANHVTAIELVTADGQHRRVDCDHEPELFWALRGGNATFGVVTALEFELLPVHEVYAGALFFPWERSSEVLHSWRDWLPQMPDRLTSVGRILRFPLVAEIPEPLRGNSFALIEAVWLGSEPDGAELLEPLRRLGPAIDTFATVAPAGIAELHMDPRDPVAAAGWHTLLADLPARAIDDVVEMVGPGSGSPLLTFELRHLGGALASPAPGHGALGAISGSFSAFGAGVTPDQSAAGAVRDHFQTLQSGLGEYESGYLFPNFTLEAVEPTRFFDPDTLARLRRVRSECDPDGMIVSKHAI